MEPTRQEEEPSYAGLDPVCMRMSPWYSEGDDSQPLASKGMNEDSSGAKRSQYQIPRLVAKDEERFARKKGDIPPPLPKRIDNPRIREDLALMDRTQKRYIKLLLRILMHKHGSITVSLFFRRQ